MGEPGTNSCCDYFLLLQFGCRSRLQLSKSTLFYLFSLNYVSDDGDRKRRLASTPANLPSMSNVHFSGRLSSSLKDDTSASNELVAKAASSSAKTVASTGATGKSAAGASSQAHHFRSGKHFMEWMYKVESELDRRGDCDVNKCCSQLQVSLGQIHRLLDKVGYC